MGVLAKRRVPQQYAKPLYDQCPKYSEGLLVASRLINTRYEVIEPLPSLSSLDVRVYKARDTIEGRVVTAWVFELSEFPTGSRERMTQVENARFYTQLSCTNLAPIYSVEDNGDTGELCIVSEYVNGISLRERIRRVAPFSLAVAVDIAIGVGTALVATHEAGFTCGTVSRDSVLIASNGTVKLVGLFCSGNPAGENNSAAAADTVKSISTIGEMIYNMLTATDVSEMRGDVDTVSPRIVVPELPMAIDGLVAKCLIDDSSVRYRSVSDVVHDLKAIREALRMNKSLSWSPLESRPAHRAARMEAGISFATPVTMGPPVPPHDASVTPPIANRTSSAISDKEQRVMEKDASDSLGVAIKVLLVVVVIALAGLVFFGSKFFAVPKDVTVPRLVGLTFDEANAEAAKQSFKIVEGNSDYNSIWPENQIYQQDPPAGHLIKAGRSVTVLRSLGPRLLTVPDLVGGTADRATRELQEAEFPAGTSTEDFSETIPVGIVLTQDPPANSKAERDTTVKYVVSKGKQPPDVPTGVDAQPQGDDRVEISWSPSPRASTYVLTRDQDGDSKVLAQTWKDTKFTDTGLTPDTSYSYTVQATNAAGSSDPSDPALVITPSKITATPVMPNNVEVSPPSGDTTHGSSMSATTDGTSTGSSARMRQFVIRFRVPRHPRGDRRVQFEVQDATGSTLMYDETHQAGDRIAEPITAFGNKITFRIFLDTKLVKQQTL